MARKHFDEYYNKIYAQVKALNMALEEMSKEVSEGMIEPERLDQLKKTVEPVWNSYQTLSYIKYLLDKPARKSKEGRYVGMNKQLLANAGDRTGNNIISSNNKILSSLINK